MAKASSKEKGLAPQGVMTTAPQELTRTRSCTTKMRQSRQIQRKLWWKLEQGGFAMLRPAASWRHVGIKASWLVKQELVGSWQARARNLRNKSSHLGLHSLRVECCPSPLKWWGHLNFFIDSHLSHCSSVRQRTAACHSNGTPRRFFSRNNNIIYHDFLPTPRRGSHVKSGKTHTQSSRYTP